MRFEPAGMAVSNDSVLHGARHTEIVVAGMHVRWQGVWQRPHHILSRLSNRVPVVVLEEPVAASSNVELIAKHGGVTIVTPRRRADLDNLVDQDSIRTIRSIVGDRKALVWLYTPMMIELTSCFVDAPVVFDKMDDLSAFQGADPLMEASEKDLVDIADFVFAGGRSLYRGISDRARASACYPSGVDADHFARAFSERPHRRLASFADRTIYGYIGVIDERIDLELIAAIADRFPAAVIAMVGPVTKISLAALPRRPNIVYLGLADYHELPSYLAGFDVALMPFALNRHTASISPTKTLEYLAAGKPVVSTAIDDVIADFSGVVQIARTHAEFLETLGTQASLAPTRLSGANEMINAASWDAIVQRMLVDLARNEITLGSCSSFGTHSVAHMTPLAEAGARHLNASDV